MVVNSYRKLPGKGTNLLPSLKLNPILQKTPENPYNPPAVAITSRIELQYLLPLVVKVCQRPGFAIARIQCHSTVISLYKMCAQDNQYWGFAYEGSMHDYKIMRDLCMTTKFSRMSFTVPRKINFPS